MRDNPSSKLGILHNKFEKSGLGEHPVITDEELKELKSLLTELSNYMRDREDSSMSMILRMDAERVERMIAARRDY